MNKIYAVFLTVLVCSAFPTGAEDLWPSLRRTPDGTASLPYKPSALQDQIKEWHFTYKPNRRYDTDIPVWASPALAIIEGRPTVFIGGYDQALHALDLLSKKRLWSKISNGPIRSAPAVGIVNGISIVVWGSSDRSLYACHTKTGRTLWTRELIPPSNTLGDTIIGAPLLHDDRVYISCFVHDKSLPRNSQKGWLYALNIEDGRILWRQEVSQGPVSSPAGRDLDGAFHVFIAARKGLLQCFDVSGALPKRVWRFQMPHEVLGSPVIESGKKDPLLFLGSKFGNFIAIDARTGREKWQQMTGNWVDNTACIGKVDGENVVFVGSYDYILYAFTANSGKLLWNARLNGEIYSAPSFFHLEGKPSVVVSSLDNHLYLINARSGKVITSYFSGQPVWDVVTKGETLWGSPAVFEAGENTVAVHGSYNGTVYILPLHSGKKCSVSAQARSSKDLWFGLLIVLVLFLGLVIPLTVKFPECFPRKRT